MNTSSGFEIDPKQQELLARNVPEDFYRVVRGLTGKLDIELAKSNTQMALKFEKVTGYLHPSTSELESNKIHNELRRVLCVYRAMKQSVDQVINPKDISKEIRSVRDKLITAEARLRNDEREQLLIDRLEIDDIADLGNNLSSFRATKQIDEKIVVTRLLIEKTLSEISEIHSYFQYKADKISGPGRRKNDYSVHYLVFALADMFNEIGKIEAAIMISFNDDGRPISPFWDLVRTFCETFDRDIMNEYNDRFPEFIKSLCRRYAKTNYSTKEFTRRPDTQKLLDFMSVVHRVKSRK